MTAQQTTTTTMPPRLTMPGEPKAVEVWCHAPDAAAVFLAGTFNGWSPTATSMERVGGNWRAKLQVVPGLYSYNFVIDGKWVCDPNHMLPRPRPCQILNTHWLG